MYVIATLCIFCALVLQEPAYALNNVTVGGERAMIIGGEDAQPGQFPYQMFLRVTKDSGDNLCGGTLLTEKYILTAAHCLKDVINPSDITVTAAEYDFFTPEGNEQDRTVIKMTSHELYNGDSKLGYDIAVLQVSPAFDLNNLVTTAKLSTSDPDPGVSCTILGWGTTHEV
ncbi:unnamed protein product, partial [Meganyctiphanes norvegica]